MFAVQIVELGPPLVVGVGHLAVDVVEELASDGGAAGRAGARQGPAIRFYNGYTKSNEIYTISVT